MHVLELPGTALGALVCQSGMKWSSSQTVLWDEALPPDWEVTVTVY